MEDWCGGTPDSRSKWSDKRGAAWLIVRSELLVSRRTKVEYIKPVWLFVARSFTTHKQRASTCEFCQMRDVNKICKYVKNEPQDERLPRKFPQGIRPGTRLWDLPDLLTFIWYHLFLNNSGAFGDFKTFFHGQIKCFNPVKWNKRKKRPLKVGSNLKGR